MTRPMFDEYTVAAIETDLAPLALRYENQFSVAIAERASLAPQSCDS